MAKPQDATTLRVTCKATGFVGFDVDGYFDDLSLVATNTTRISDIIIFGDASIKANQSTTLTAYNGSTTDPSAYIWESSYDAFAVVSNKGKVTLTSEYNPEEGVTIYVTDRKTGLTAEFLFGNRQTNEQTSLLGKVSGLKVINIGKKTATLTWKKNNKATGYIIQRYDKLGKKWKTVSTIKKRGTVKYKIKSLRSKTTYKYRVVSYKSFGNYNLQAPSKAVTFKTK